MTDEGVPLPDGGSAGLQPSDVGRNEIGFSRGDPEVKPSPSTGGNPDPMTAPSTAVAPRTFSLKQTALLCVVLALAVIALYARVNQYPFVNYDDGDYITNNLHVQAG